MVINNKDILLSFVLVSAIFIGCGGGGGKSTVSADITQGSDKQNSIKNTNSSSGVNDSDKIINMRDVNITKKVVVTDDYIIGATVTTREGRKAIALKQIGQYGFADLNTSKKYIFKSQGGYVDFDGNKLSKGEPKQYIMYSTSDKTYINPFTTFATLTSHTDKEVASFFGIPNVDMDTSINDYKIRSAVAYANAMLKKAEHEDFLFSKQIAKTSSNKGGSVLPFANINYYQKVYDAVSQRMQQKKQTLAYTIYEFTGIVEYKNLPRDIKLLNALIKSKMMNVFADKKVPSKKPPTPCEGPGCIGNDNNTGEVPSKKPPTPCEGPGCIGAGSDSATTKIQKTQDGYTMVDIKNNQATIPANAKVIRVDRVAFFLKDSTKMIYVAPNNNHEIYPPNPPAFPNSVKPKKIDDKNLIIELKKGSLIDGLFRFQPLYIDYK